MGHIIYKLTNKVTGKMYVGQTKDIKERMAAHKCCAGNCRYLHNSIRKYGWEAFVLEILEEGITREEACRAEGKHIVLLNTLAPNGYNLTIDTDESRTFSEETLVLKSHVGQKREIKLGASGFIGVVYNGSNRRPSLQLRHRRRGYTYPFDTEIEAAEAYDRMAIYLHGPGARINFVDNLDTYLREDLKAFYDRICTKTPKSSRYEFVCWHKSAGSWWAYYPKSGGGFESLGSHLTEEEAHAAVELYRTTGQRRPPRPAGWKTISDGQRVLYKAQYLYTVRGPDGQMYEAISLRYLAESHGIEKHSLLNSWVHKRPTVRGPAAGWNVMSRIPLTSEHRERAMKTNPYTTWWPINVPGTNLLVMK